MSMWDFDKEAVAERRENLELQRARERAAERTRVQGAERALELTAERTRDAERRFVTRENERGGYDVVHATTGQEIGLGLPQAVAKDLAEYSTEVVREAAAARAHREALARDAHTRTGSERVPARVQEQNARER